MAKSKRRRKNLTKEQDDVLQRTKPKTEAEARAALAAAGVEAPGPDDQVEESKDPTKACPRCDGDGVWHSTKTGYRANTSTESLIDRNRQCPECKGSGEGPKQKPVPEPEPEPDPYLEETEDGEQ